MQAETYELLSLNYFKKGWLYVADVVIRQVGGEELVACAESTHSVFEAIFEAVDKALGSETTCRWHFGKYDFQPINPRRRLSKKACAKARVYINYPHGDGFCGVYQDSDMGLALAAAYISAINRLVRGRVGREEVLLV